MNQVKLGDTVRITGFHIYEGFTGVVIDEESAVYQIRLPSGSLVCAEKNNVVPVFDETSES